MPTIWGYGDHGLAAGTMTAWGYPAGRVPLTLTVTDVLVITDNAAIVRTLVFAESFNISDDIELVIPSWLRKVHIGDDVYRVVINRIR